MPLSALLVSGSSSQGVGAGPDLGRYLTLSAILILAIGLLAFGFKKLVARSARSRAGGRSLELLDVLSLGGKQRLCVVRLYDRTFALGVGEHAVHPIAELDGVIGEERAKGGRRKSFAGALADAASVEAALRAEPVPAPRAATPRARELREGGVLA
jgi:flagellar biogenesis protein FliO